MSTIELPIIGQGSQPPEADGAELEYMQMPEDMATYRMPDIRVDVPEPMLQPGKRVLRQLLALLTDFTPGEVSASLDLMELDDDNRYLIDQVIGEGEVSILYSGWPRMRIQESVLAGVWRVQTLDADNRIVADNLEVGEIPALLSGEAFGSASDAGKLDIEGLPDGVMNAPPLLTEINAQLTGRKVGDAAYVINLSLLPHTEQDLALLNERLGAGKLTILSRGYGNCRISSTATEPVWWVQYFNSQDTLILNTLEVTEVPEVACASVEDIEDSRERLREILKVYL